MKTTYHIPASASDKAYPAPKRGDLFESNIGTRMERTWLVIAVRTLPQRECRQMGGIMTRRYKVWAERWWQLEPEMRVKLFRSAERAGGQVEHCFRRFPAKPKKRTFEQYMGAR